MPETVMPEILDCTIRDGGYVNNWHFDKKIVREVYRALSKGGVDIVELGFRGSAKYFDPDRYGPWRFTSEADIHEVISGIDGARIAVMGDYGKIDLEDLEDRKNTPVEMIRIAAHKNQVAQAIELLGRIKTKGYKTSLQAMGFTSYTEAEKDDLRSRTRDSDLDYFYIADSYGSIFPNEMAALFGPFLELAGVKVGFHPHNSLQMAFANTLEAIRLGVHIVDGSVYGMGRGSGNLPTEVLIAYLGVQGRPKYNVIPILQCIERYFIEIKKEKPWGYQLPYMISGMFRCHPYYATELMDRREYSIEDIWKALEVVEDMKPIGFDRTIIEHLIKKGVVGSLGRSALNQSPRPAAEPESRVHVPVPYLNRHPGRDCLILANGPSLKECQKDIRAFIDRYRPVVMGANYLGGLFAPDYHAFTNKKRFSMYVDSVSPDSRLMIGENISREMIGEYVHREYETLYFRDVLDADFDIADGRIMSNCRTVSVLLAGVAVVMGARRIFIAGMDGYLLKKDLKSALFYNEKYDPVDENLNIRRHYENERFLKQIDEYVRAKGFEGIHIITPTSHKAFYKGLENYLS